MVAVTGDYIVINQGAPNGKYWVNFKSRKIGEAGRIQAISDGQGNIATVIAGLMASGYNKSQIIYNGSPLTDVYHRGF